MKNVFYMDCNENVKWDKSGKLKTTIFKNLYCDTFYEITYYYIRCRICHLCN